MKVIRKIIKEELDKDIPCGSTEFKWTCSIEPGGIPYMRYIETFEEMLDCCSKTKWSVAYRGGEQYFNQYMENGRYEVYFDKNDEPKAVCTNGQCFEGSDHAIDMDKISIDGKSAQEIYERSW